MQMLLQGRRVCAKRDLDLSPLKPIKPINTKGPKLTDPDDVCPIASAHHVRRGATQNVKSMRREATQHPRIALSCPDLALNCRGSHQGRKLAGIQNHLKRAALGLPRGALNINFPRQAGGKGNREHSQGALMPPLGSSQGSPGFTGPGRAVWC